jgi:3-oxoacyl-(acyl-carrier-protein) synthase
MAVNELALGQSDLVITGGVDAMNDIFMYMCFSKTPALSPSGDCRPFSDKADGTMLGEGLGMVALKRLDDAERDGDAIYAVIRGLGSSSDGRAKSVYAPSAQGQARALVAPTSARATARDRRARRSPRHRHQGRRRGRVRGAEARGVRRSAGAPAVVIALGA